LSPHRWLAVIGRQRLHVALLIAHLSMSNPERSTSARRPPRAHTQPLADDHLRRSLADTHTCVHAILEVPGSAWRPSIRALEAVHRTGLLHQHDMDAAYLAELTVGTTFTEPHLPMVRDAEVSPHALIKVASRTSNKNCSGLVVDLRVTGYTALNISYEPCL